jgi:3-phenylpropionate/trans-cinnamate dioxygenase ferredoxin component
MSIVDVAAVGDVPLPGAIRVSVDGVAVAIARDDCGVYAIEDRCSHADVALSEGEVADCTIECWLHGSAFDLRTGAALTLPATEPVAVYHLELAGEGDAARVLVDVHRTADSVIDSLTGSVTDSANKE